MEQEKLLVRLAVLEHQNNEQNARLTRMESDMREVRDIIVASKGGWKAMVGLSALVGGAGSLITWLVEHAVWR